ncbi:MAG: beta-lactamase family protein [Treponema sp.]|jgi:CubicO group peptidase (beta-lactamase class C family)|nr:beta-lactamase family protein [Treponema sp.]
MKKYNFEKAGRMIEQAVREGIFPSAVFSIGRREEVFLREAYGVINTEIPPDRQENADLHTRYDIASLTKIAGPTLIALRMAEEGLVSLNDTIGYFFDAPEDKRNITLFQLMTHTCGFQNFPLIEKAASAEREGIIDAIVKYPLGFAPGRDVLYTCISFILLGYILEKAGGQTLDKLFLKWVGEPLGLENSGFCPKGANIAATEYSQETGKCLSGIVHDENARFLSGISGNAGIFLDIFDMEKICIMLSRSISENCFLRKDTTAMAVKNYTPGMAQNRGIGFHLARSRAAPYAGDRFLENSFGHTGFTGTSFLIEKETGIWAALLSNRVHPSRKNEKILAFRNLWHNEVRSLF